MDILWDPYESLWYICKFLNDIVAEFPGSHGAIYCTHRRRKKSYVDLWQMDCNASLRGVKWPKWHAICSMHSPHTLIDTLRNAKVAAQTARIHFKICTLCNFRALSMQYNAFVSGHFFKILVCSHATIVDRAALEFWQRCHLGIHGIRHGLWKHTSILVLCICQEEGHIYIYNIYIYIYIYI